MATDPIWHALFYYDHNPCEKYYSVTTCQHIVRMCIWFWFLFPISTFAVSFSLRFHPFYCLSTTYTYVTQSSGKIVFKEQFNFQRKCFFWKKENQEIISSTKVSSTFSLDKFIFLCHSSMCKVKVWKQKSHWSLPSLSRQSLFWSKIRTGKAYQLGKQEIDG